MTQDIKFLFDRMPLDHVDPDVVALLQEHRVGKTAQKQSVHFCGMVMSHTGQTFVFLPRNIGDPSARTAALTMQALAKFAKETSSREHLDIGQDANLGLLVTIANIAQDFKVNGLYLERHRQLSRNKGKIEWTRTIVKEPAIVADKDSLYFDFITSIGTRNSANLLAEIQAMVMKEIVVTHSWWLPNMNSRKDEFARARVLRNTNRPRLIRLLQNNKRALFSKRAISLTNWLVSYLKRGTGLSEGVFVFGVEDFHGVWETMLRSTLVNVDHSWNSKLALPAFRTSSGGLSQATNRGIRTDIIVKSDNWHSIIDAKYYSATNASNAPSVGDFAKQILYEATVREELDSDTSVRNIFVFPAPSHGAGPLSEMFMLRRNGSPAHDIPTVECRYLCVADVMTAYCEGRTDRTLNSALGI